MRTLRRHASGIFYAGIAAVEPESAVKSFCARKKNFLLAGGFKYNLDEFENVYVIGAGKAGAPMSFAIEELLGDRITEGIVNVKYGHVASLKRVKLVEAGHPLPDENGIAGAIKILELAKKAGKNDLVICLISGGGSALLPYPAAGLSLKDKQDTIKMLISCGATIHEINTIRKHISLIKGGMLAKAVFPATLVTLILSDVIGDNLDVIASGPTVQDSSTYKNCLEIIAKYGLKKDLPGKVMKYLTGGTAGKIPETPKAGERIFKKARNLVAGSAIEAIKSAKQKAESLKYNTIVLSSMIEGDTKESARFHCAIAKEIAKTGFPVPKPACIISGGETIVKLTGKGKGGRNQEFALAAALDIAGLEKTLVLCAGTDGTDGPTDAAGAFADSSTLRRALLAGMNPLSYLFDNDSYNFFKKLGDLFITGPTNTNVMDLRIVMVK